MEFKSIRDEAENRNETMIETERTEISLIQLLRSVKTIPPILLLTWNIFYKIWLGGMVAIDQGI